MCYTFCQIFFLLDDQERTEYHNTVFGITMIIKLF